MKKILAIIALLISANSYAQMFSKTPVVNYSPFELGGQLVNTANANANPVLDSIATTSSAATIYLSTATYAATGGTLYPLTGYGTLSFTVLVTKYSGTATGSIALQGSIDGVQWGPVHEGTILSSDTLQLANATTNTYTWSVAFKRFRYYRLAVICPSSTQGISVSGFWYFTKQYFYTNSK